MLACITQPDVVDAFVGGDAGRLRTSIEAIYAAMGNGFESTSGNATIDGLFSGGGMAAMLPTVWLILAALSFAAIMEEAGFLDRLIEPVVRRAHTAAGLILSVVARASASTSSPAISTWRSSSPAASSASCSHGEGSPPACSPARWRTPGPSPHPWCRGTAAAPT